MSTSEQNWMKVAATLIFKIAEPRKGASLQTKVLFYGSAISQNQDSSNFHS